MNVIIYYVDLYQVYFKISIDCSMSPIVMKTAVEIDKLNKLPSKIWTKLLRVPKWQQFYCYIALQEKKYYAIFVFSGNWFITFRKKTGYCRNPWSSKTGEIMLLKLYSYGRNQSEHRNEHVFYAGSTVKTSRLCVTDVVFVTVTRDANRDGF